MRVAFATSIALLTLGLRATFPKPTTPSDGIPYVLDGGVVIIDKGQIVADACPGKGIRSVGPVVEIAK
jgi:hypothetical protein